MRRAISCCGAALLALAPAAAAADTLPLSALPSKPARYAQAEGPFHAKVQDDPTYYTLTGTRPSVCFATEAPAYWVDGDSPSWGRWPELQVGAREPFGIERLVVRGDSAELERITAEIVYGELVPLGRSRITLHEVARLEGLVVYAYRWQSKIFVLTRSAGMPPPPPELEMAGMGDPAPECGVVQATLHLRADGTSRVSQLRGTVPGTGKRFLIDASISQTGRDPEPLLAVTARFLDR